MKILILEGTATSGKTTLINKLKIYLNKKNLTYLVLREEETLRPIITISSTVFISIPICTVSLFFIVFYSISGF